MEDLQHTTCDQVREHFATRGERDVTVRFENEHGVLLGNAVTDVYSMANVYGGTPGEYVCVVEIGMAPDDENC